MEQTLAKIADHEARLTVLETKTDKHLTQVETAVGTTKFWAPIGTWMLKVGFFLGAAAVTVLGSAKVWSLIFPGT